MGEDLSQGAKIGIILIILCSIIAIVFSIMSIMKNITNSGVEDLQNSLGSMQNQKFDDYDQRTVTGAQVISAIKLFQDQPIAIVVHTTRGNTTVKYGLTNLVDLSATASNGIYTASLPTSGFTYNNDHTNLTTKTSNAYVANSSKFTSYLIKDSSKDVIGIYFSEKTT